MKKTIVIIWLSVLTIPLYSYTWVPFCPDTINANNICFGVGSWKGVICTDDGMYLWEDDIMEWSYYTYGLPVTGAAYLDTERILVAMGAGTYSDGVYTFNLQTHQFEVVEWMINPNFLIQSFSTGKYYIGCQFGGLYESADGLSWTSVPYFDGKSCTAIDFYENHMVISEVSNIYNIYLSDDYGETWQESSVGSSMITDLKFSFEGDLYGIFPGYSNSSGLWSSADWGNTWEVEFWSDNMSAVGFDATSTSFVGWESPTIGNEGIAIYTPGTVPPNLTFLNEGLPNLNINKILMNPFMSAIAIFCCTDAGVYVCYNYMVGVDKCNVESEKISIYPNPFSNYTEIAFSITENEITTLEIYSITGKQIMNMEVYGHTVTRQSIIWNPAVEGRNLQEGIYFIKLIQGQSSIVRKVVYSR